MDEQNRNNNSDNSGIPVSQPPVPRQTQGYYPPHADTPPTGFVPSRAVPPQQSNVPPPQGFPPQQGSVPPQGVPPRQGNIPPPQGFPPQQGSVPPQGFPPPPPSPPPVNNSANGQNYGRIAGQFSSPDAPYSQGQGGSYPPPPYLPQPQGYPSAMPPIQPKKKKNTALRVALLLGLCGLLIIMIVFALLGGLFFGLSQWTETSEGSKSSEFSYDENPALPNSPDAKPDPDGPQISAVLPTEYISEETRIASEVYNKTGPSVVCITSYEAGKDYTLNAEGEGSGIIFSEDGYIVTNSHVVDDSTKTGVAVMLQDGSQYIGTVIGIDKKTDLAVIKIDGHDLPPAEFSDSDKLLVGQQVFAIGNPGGAAFSNSLTKGAISALNRQLSGDSYIKYIQTDAAINPGNSGGPLVNESGQVIGINTAKIVAFGYEGMGFSIPSNLVIEIANKLVRYGRVTDRGTLGINGTDCDLYQAKKNNVPQGMKITSINSGSPLKNTRAEKGDIITHVNGNRILGTADFTDEVKGYAPGDKIELTLFHPEDGEGETYTITVKLIADPE